MQVSIAEGRTCTKNGRFIPSAVGLLLRSINILYSFFFYFNYGERIYKSIDRQSVTGLCHTFIFLKEFNVVVFDH